METMDVNVVVEILDDDGRLEQTNGAGTTKKDWNLVCAAKAAGLGFGFTFTITEPYSIPLKQWRDFIAKGGDISFYGGNGIGCIRSYEGRLEFVAGPSGAGGDVVSRVVIPHALMAGPLKTAIEKCADEGLLA